MGHDTSLAPGCTEPEACCCKTELEILANNEYVSSCTVASCTKQVWVLTVANHYVLLLW